MTLIPIWQACGPALRPRCTSGGYTLQFYRTGVPLLVRPVCHRLTHPRQPALPSLPLVGRAATIVGMVLVVGVAFVLWLGPPASQKNTSSQSPAVIPEVSPAMAPLATGDEPIGRLFSQAGCTVCHTIPGIQGADGRVGPKLVVGLTGPKRLADPSYRGTPRRCMNTWSSRF